MFLFLFKVRAMISMLSYVTNSSIVKENTKHGKTVVKIGGFVNFLTTKILVAISTLHRQCNKCILIIV